MPEGDGTGDDHIRVGAGPVVNRHRCTDPDCTLAMNPAPVVLTKVEVGPTFTDQRDTRVVMSMAWTTPAVVTTTALSSLSEMLLGPWSRFTPLSMSPRLKREVRGAATFWPVRVLSTRSEPVPRAATKRRLVS